MFTFYRLILFFFINVRNCREMKQKTTIVKVLILHEMTLSFKVLLQPLLEAIFQNKYKNFKLFLSKTLTYDYQMSALCSVKK